MKTWKVLLFIGAVVAAVVLSGVLAWRHGLMPDLSGYEKVVRGPQLCPHGLMLRVGYNRPGSDPGIAEALAFYHMSESLEAGKPFAVVLFETDVVGGLLKVYVDHNLDGRTDVSGKPGERGIGRSPCDALPVTQARR